MTDGSAAISKGTGVPDPLIGRVINDRFKINALIARGGMGKVYRAEQAPLGRVCAIKVLNPNYAGEHDPEFHKRFFLEASIASKLTHPNTVTIFDYGRTEDDIYYMAMEYLEGHTLHRAIREAGALPRGARGSHRPPDLPRPARGALARRHPPRSQAGEHLPRRARRRDRLREGARLRPGEERLGRRRPKTSRRRASSWAARSTWRPSRFAATASTPARTSTRSASSCTR